MIPYKTQLKGKTIEKNAAFKKLRKADQKREIALDALKLILADKIRPAGGMFKGVEYPSGYWTNYELLSVIMCDDNAEKYQDTLLNNLPICHVCQVGMLMVSKIRIGNKIKPYDKGHHSGSHGTAKPFSAEELSNMENSYEGLLLSSSQEDNIFYPSNTLRNMANSFCAIIDKGKFNIKDTFTDYLKLWKIKIVE